MKQKDKTTHEWETSYVLRVAVTTATGSEADYGRWFCKRKDTTKKEGIGVGRRGKILCEIALRLPGEVVEIQPELGICVIRRHGQNYTIVVIPTEEEIKE